MSRMKRLLVLGGLAAGLVVACSSDGTSGATPPPGGGSPPGNTPPAYTPSNHVLANDLPGTIQTHQYLDVPFQISTASAQISYQVADRSSTSPDNIRTAVVPDSEIGYLMNGQPFKSYGDMSGTAPLSGMGSVPAGSYHFVVLCENTLENCQFSYTLDAFY